MATACAKAPTPMSDAPEIHARPKIVGARVKRTEDPRLLTGLGAYTDDRQVARVLHVAFRRSDHSHARIRAIDCDRRRAPRRASSRCSRRTIWPTAVKPLVATSRMPELLRDADPAAGARQGALCRRAGRRRDRAKSRYLAEDALELIAIDYEPLPVVIDPRGRAAPARRCCTRKPAPTCWSAREFKRGDVDAAMRSGAGARQRPLPHAPQDAGRDRAARLPCRIRCRAATR